MARIKKALPDVIKLQEHLDYNPRTGEFRWKKPTARCTKPWSLAGFVSHHGYWQISFYGSSWMAHRLAWLMYHGEDLGQQEIDHIDGNKLNNAIDNLRVASPTENQHNIKRKGFYWHKKDKKWRARGYHEGSQIDLGSFDCPLLARLAYEDFKKEVAGDFCPF